MQRNWYKGMAAAAIAATSIAAGLPDLPPPPELFATPYPDCRDAWQAAAPLDQAGEINRCTDAIDRYYRETILPFRKAMIDHQVVLSRLYADRVAARPDFSVEAQQDFYRRMMREHAESDPSGSHQAASRAAESRYQADRTYLQDRYCFVTGCGGYPAPVIAAAPKAEKQAKAPAPKQQAALQPGKAKAPQTNCKKARKAGSAVGGLLGGLAGRATGIKGAGSVLAGALGGLVVGELACQLDEKEQVKAAEATVAVTKKEEVGATSTWQSPTRAGVSGSSTVTAVNATPNGEKCLSITDVAIIDGQETRVQKQMCKSGSGGYRIV